MHEIRMKLLILAIGWWLGWFFTSLFTQRYRVPYRDKELERIVLEHKKFIREKKEKLDAAD